MNAPLRQWGESDVLRFYCRHLVALCVSYELTMEHEAVKEPRFAAYSGTLIEIGGAIHWLTAGHVITEIEEALRDDRVEIVSAVLADTFGSCACEHPIPFDLESAHFFHIDDDAQGLDFGVMALPPYYVRLLAANGVVALQEANWIHQERVKFDGYAMLGLPEEFTAKRLSASGNATVLPTMFRVRRLDSLPDGKPPTRYPQFVGQLDRDLGIASVKGMSGGPIFGFSLESPIRYWVVALQSSWNPTKRIVYGCSLPVLASLMTSWMTEDE